MLVYLFLCEISMVLAALTNIFLNLGKLILSKKDVR